MSLQWYVLRTLPIARAEFSVMHAIQQSERPAIVPFEEKWVRRPGTKQRIARKYPLFPRYVFAGFSDYGDFRRTQDAINALAVRKGKAPPVLGAIQRIGSAEPAKLSLGDVEFLKALSVARPTEINLHRALQPGGRVNILEGPFSGHIAQVDTVTRKSVSVMLKMFNSMQVVRLPVAAVEAA